MRQSESETSVDVCQDNPEDMSTIDSCEYIWEAGVGFTHSPTTAASYDRNRCEILKLLLACFSETMYMPPIGQSTSYSNTRCWSHH